MQLGDVVSQLQKPKQTAKGYTALCPAHGDSKPSLSISEGDGGKIYAGATLQMLSDGTRGANQSEPI